MSTLLADLVRKQTAHALFGVFNRTIEKVAEEFAHDLLRDAEFRADLEQLVRLALQQALKELHDPAPPSEPQRSDRELQQYISEQRQLIADMIRTRETKDRKDQPEGPTR